jgi:hypothetical protein
MASFTMRQMGSTSASRNRWKDGHLVAVGENPGGFGMLPVDGQKR